MVICLFDGIWKDWQHIVYPVSLLMSAGSLVYTICTGLFSFGEVFKLIIKMAIKMNVISSKTLHQTVTGVIIVEIFSFLPSPLAPFWVKLGILHKSWFGLECWKHSVMSWYHISCNASQMHHYSISAEKFIRDCLECMICYLVYSKCQASSQQILFSWSLNAVDTEIWQLWFCSRY